MSFDYLSSVTILNMQSQDNSLTLLNDIKHLTSRLTDSPVETPSSANLERIAVA